MTRAALAFLVCATALVATPADAQIAGCTKFCDNMETASGDLKVSFVRPLVVSRGAQSDFDQYDLISHARIDGVLRCRGETFVSFEATIHMPADSALIERFTSAQTASLVAALGWSHTRARTKADTLAHEAADYLRGSEERGDVEVAGKLEEHLPDDVTVGAIWTRTERTFLLLHEG